MADLRHLNGRNRKLVQTLTRRRKYLLDMLAEQDDGYPGHNWDRQEVAAISFALAAIKEVYDCTEVAAV